MKQLLSVLALFALTTTAFSQETCAPKPILDKIQFELSAKQWVTTPKATLSVAINATLNNADLVKARADIMTRLNKIATSDWHLIAFDRSQDSSGLEKLYVQAQARVEQSTLTDVYQQAKAVSFPGAKYEINGIEFKPDLEEKQEVMARIRDQLYQKIIEELSRINKLYPNQNYSVKHVVFFEADQAIQPRAFQAKSANAMAVSAAPSLTLSNELVLKAQVEVASNRKKEN